MYLNELKGKSILIYDLETATYNQGIDAKKNKLKVMGAYSYKTNKYYVIVDKNAMYKLFLNHDIVLGFNNFGYDNLVLQNNDFNLLLRYNKFKDIYLFKDKINLDLRKIIIDNIGIFKTKKGYLAELLMDFKLDTITRVLDLVDDETAKDEIDYNVFNKDKWTKEEIIKIKKYTKRDIEITKKLFEWIIQYMETFIPFLYEENVKDLSYLNMGSAGIGYNALCKELDLPPEFQNSDPYKNVKRPKNKGGYVAYPAVESIKTFDYDNIEELKQKWENEKQILCMDYSSAHPHSIMHGNLLDRYIFPNNITEEQKQEIIKREKLWHGGGVYNIHGYYRTDKMGAKTKVVKKFYKLRKELKKKKDPKQYALKIIINSIYGILDSHFYKNTYDPIAAADCTEMSRHSVLLARKKFNEAGFKVCYTDTDSVYFQIKSSERKKAFEIKEQIIKEIKNPVPFPQETYEMDLDDEITHMFFFKGDIKEKDDKDEILDEMDKINKPKQFLKKNYIYIKLKRDKNGEIIDTAVAFKNLGVKKKSTSALTRYIFRQILLPLIKKEKRVKFKKSFLRKEINRLIKENMEYVLVRKSTKPIDEYKNPNIIEAKLSEKFGPGIHFVIKNKRIGIKTKGGDYWATKEEFIKKGGTIDDLILDNVWKELKYFIEPVKSLNSWF